MTSPDSALFAAGAAPGVADPVQPVAAKGGVYFAKPYWANDDVVGHGSHHPCTPVTRLCLACGVVRECDPALPCGECGASSFHLIPLASRSQ